MIDRYFIGKSKRISPESPVPVFDKVKEKNMLGGASNVAANLRAADQNVSIMSVIGNDENADILLKLLKDLNIDTNFIIRDKLRRTTVKTRILGQGNHQMFRIDEEDTLPISEEIEYELCSNLKNEIKKYDALILSDYLKGVLTESSTQKIIKIANKNGVKVFIDVKDTNYKKYKGAFLLKPNLIELSSLTQKTVETQEQIIEASNFLCSECSCEYVLTTQGGNGMTLLDSAGINHHIDCVAKEVFDVTGAGDTVISYLVLAYLNGINMVESAEFSNYAAGVKVSKKTTTAIKLSEVYEYINEQNIKQGKILTLGTLVNTLKYRENKNVVFTNGCFDILHVGHIRYLKEAAKLGDILVVGINSDESVKRLKGDSRPVVCQEDRMEVISSLDCVDYVVMFEEDTPLEIIKKIKPDILVKGGDYTVNNIVGKDFVESIGGRVKVLSLIKGKSSTNIINKIKF